jgi:transposase-like protein
MNIDSFMPGEEECLEHLRVLRWSGGVRCVFCGSELVVKTGMHGKHVRAQRYHCKACDRWFNDKTGTPFAGSHLPLRVWFFVAFLMQFRVSVMEISHALGLRYATVFEMVKKLRRSLYARRIPEKLRGEVEMDEAYVKAGLKGKRGLRREPRKRGYKARGRGTYEGDKVPIVAAVERGGGRIRIQPHRNVKARVVIKRYQRDVDPRARVYTDEFPSYDVLPGDRHFTVNHGDGEYSNGDGVHINTVEAEFSVLRPWMATFRGVSKERLYLYISHYEFLRNNRGACQVERMSKMIEILQPPRPNKANPMLPEEFKWT